MYSSNKTLKRSCFVSGIKIGVRMMIEKKFSYALLHPERDGFQHQNYMQRLVDQHFETGSHHNFLQVVLSFLQSIKCFHNIVKLIETDYLCCFLVEQEMDCPHTSSNEASIVHICLLRDVWKNSTRLKLFLTAIRGFSQLNKLHYTM
jgi:hypothetical protein